MKIRLRNKFDLSLAFLFDIFHSYFSIERLLVKVERVKSRSSYLQLFEAIMSTEMHGSHLLEKNSLLGESSIIISTNKVVVKQLGEETVDHVLRAYSRIQHGILSLVVDQHCKKLCGGMEISC